MIGKTIGHYEILEQIGQGGMGEVYLAQDTSLERKVALKFLPEVLQQDAIAPQRFLREARSAAAIDHPFICKIYEIGEAEERSFIAMEYVEGETLEARLKKERLSYREVLRIGSEITEALQRAHQSGIVHRDLKPSNIMLTPEGRVKVMDFGLAKKVISEDGTEQDITAGLTKEGTTLGTLAYMSPEQLRGEKVDARSDIFSFGILLFEMLIGQHPFRRAKAMETSAAILAEEPAFPTGSQAGQGITLHPLIQRTLTKDPARRVQSIEEVHGTLSQLLEEATPAHWTRKWQYWAAALAVIILAGAAMYQTLVPQSTPGLTKLVKLTTDGREKGFHWIATDGRTIYYSECDNPYVPRTGSVRKISVSGGESKPLGLWPGETRRTLVLDLSPDGNELLVKSRIAGDSMRNVYRAADPLWTVSLAMAAARRVGEVEAQSARWSPDGQRIVYSKGRELWVVGRNGKAPSRIYEESRDGAVLYVWSWAPDGRRICFGTLGGELWTVNSDGTDGRRLLPDFGDSRRLVGQFTPRGDWFLFRVQERDGVANFWATLLSDRWWNFSDVPPSELTSDLIDYKGFALDPEGQRLFTLAKEWEYELVRLYGEEWVRYNFDPEPSALFLDFSPDGRRVTYLREPEGALWVSALDGTQKTRLTEPGLQVPAFPSWSPDGQRIAFTLKKRNADGGQVHVIRWDRTDSQIVLDEEFLQHSASWAPDGKLLVSYLRGTQPLKVIDLQSGTVEDVTDSKNLHAAVYSPDGRFIAAQRTGGADAGKLAIYDEKTERWSTVQDAHPRLVILWSRDSRHLYFSGPPRTLYRVRIADWEIEKVADFNDFGSQSPLDYSRADAWWFCFDTDETLVSTRVPTATEIYTRDLELP